MKSTSNTRGRTTSILRLYLKLIRQCHRLIQKHHRIHRAKFRGQEKYFKSHRVSNSPKLRFLRASIRSQEILLMIQRISKPFSKTRQMIFQTATILQCWRQAHVPSVQASNKLEDPKTSFLVCPSAEATPHRIPITLITRWTLSWSSAKP